MITSRHTQDMLQQELDCYGRLEENLHTSTLGNQVPCNHQQTWLHQVSSAVENNVLELLGNKQI